MAKRKSKVDIEQLTPIEQIRLRPGMWIGSAENPTTIFVEIIDNALDELFSGRTDKIEISTDINKYFIVKDWGHGIELTSSKMPNCDVPVELVTKLFSGGKFFDSYGFSSGMHGCGMVVVNAMCEQFILTTLYDDDNYIRYYFDDGIFNKKEIIPKHKQTFSTEIRFKPSSKYFESLEYNEEIIKEKLYAANCCISDESLIIYNGERITDNTISNFMEGIEEDYIRCSESVNRSGEEVKLFLGLTNTDNGKDFRGVVNLIPTNDGTHFRCATNVVKSMLFEIAQRKKMHIKTPEDILVPIKIALILKLKSPTFDSQTKNKLTSKKEIFETGITKCVYDIISKNGNFIESWLKRSEEYRIQIESNKSDKKHKVGKNIIVKGLFECMDHKSNDCDLFLLEGESAGGSLIKCRDPKKHAVLALRGKPLNVAVKSKAMILQNDVINSICAALGYKPFGKIDPDICRYNRIFFLADSDADGCFSGDTRIMTIDNKGYTTFEELVENKIQTVKVYSVNYNGEIIIADAVNPRITKYVKKINKLIINDKEIQCTADHKFMLANGSYKNAEDLTCNDNLRYLSFKDGKNLKLDLNTLLKIKNNTQIELNEPIPMYDITVDETHNFCISTNEENTEGVFVHNSHITSLLTILFQTLLPELIQAGKVFDIEGPLFGYTENGKFIPIYDIKEARDLIASGKKLTRFKGLGEMDPNELYATAVDPTTRHLKKIIYNDINFKKEWDSMGNLIIKDYDGF